MYLFKEKENLLKSLPYMGLMVAINVIVSLIAAFFPILSLIFVLILPLVSVLVGLFIKWRFYPIYFVASLGASILVTMFHMEFTLFYLLPSLITGFILSIFIKNKLNITVAIFICSIINTSLALLSIPLINFIFEIDIVNNILTLVKLVDKTYVSIIVPATIISYSLMELSLSFIIIENELKKIKIYDSKNDSNLVLVLSFLTLTISMILFDLFVIELSFVILILTIVYSVILTGEYISKLNIKKLISIGVLFVSSSIIFVVLYQYVPSPYKLQLLAVYPILLYLFFIFEQILQKIRNKNIMAKEEE